MRESTEITLLGVSWLILVSPSLAEVALTKRLASGICSQFNTWKNTKEIPPPLKSAKKALENNVPCSFLERKACTGDANCVPFQCTGSGSSMGSVNSIAKGGSPGMMAMSAKSGSKTRMTNAPGLDPHAAIEADGKWNRIAAGQPGSPFGNPNNPNNLTFFPCVSTKNPYNKWKGRKRRGTDGNELAEEFVDDFADDDLQGYLTNLGAPKKERIIGGSNATDNLFPYAARIAFCVKYCYWDHKNTQQNAAFSVRSSSWNETRRCTGIILNKWYVLTSGSCGRWLNFYRLADQNPDLKLPIFDCDPKTNPLCPIVPESFQYLRNLTDIFLYFGEFQYKTGETWNRERRSMRSVVVSCETSEVPFVQSDTYSIVELYAYLNYKEPSFWPLYLSNVTRKVRDSIPNSPTYNKQVDEGRPFRQVNGKIRALFVGWGNTNADKLEWSNYLKYIRMNIISPDDSNCFNVLSRTFYVPVEAIRTQYFCAKFDDSETSTNNALCRGDVGGPLVCETETGYERLCGILTTENITGTHRSDSGTCNPKITLYPFHNMTTTYNINRVAADIRRPAQGKQQGWRYRAPGKWLQDEEETLSFTQWRTFERTWSSQGVKN